MCGTRGGDRESRPHLENHKAIGFLSNTGQDALENHNFFSYKASIQCCAVLARFLW